MQRSIPEALAAVSDELAALGEMAGGLQLLLSPAAGVDAVALQRLDLLTQTLACLASFVAGLVAAAPCACSFDLGSALRAISLADLARRLEDPGADAATACSASPDYELFDLELGSMDREGEEAVLQMGRRQLPWLNGAADRRGAAQMRNGTPAAPGREPAAWTDARPGERN